jgi:hypothetical protein
VAERKTQRTTKRARQRVASRPGPLPLVLKGFNRRTLEWDGKVPAAIVLAALRAGATWDLAAKTAKLNQATPREWNTRGAEVLASLPDEGAELADDVPDETVAYLLFHLEAESARVGTVIAALSAIDRAARQTKDQRLAVTAAELILKRHPDAKPYRPDPRLELTGPEGGPIPVTLRDEAKAKLEQMAERLAANAAGTDSEKRANVPEEPTPNEE